MLSFGYSEICFFLVFTLATYNTVKFCSLGFRTELNILGLSIQISLEE